MMEPDRTPNSNLAPLASIAASRTNHICLLAKYTEWMNARLYEAAMRLPQEELAAGDFEALHLS